MKTEIGKIIEALPNLEFKVERANENVMRCYTCGRMKMNHIRCQVGDTVEIKIPEQGEIGTIIRRK